LGVIRLGRANWMGLIVLVRLIDRLRKKLLLDVDFYLFSLRLSQMWIHAREFQIKKREIFGGEDRNPFLR